MIFLAGDSPNTGFTSSKERRALVKQRSLFSFFLRGPAEAKRGSTSRFRKQRKNLVRLPKRMAGLLSRFHYSSSLTRESSIRSESRQSSIHQRSNWEKRPAR